MRMAQIGAGGRGRDHARILSQLGVLCAVCDEDEKRGRECSEKYSVRSYNSVDELLAGEEEGGVGEKFDGAFVCTPISTHFQIAAKLLGAKKHVFVEKPLTYDSNEGRELLELSKRNNVVLASGHTERFNPAAYTVKDLVKSKKYGELVMLEFHRENGMPTHVKDAGVIYDTSVSDIDTAMWLFDETPNVVFAKAGRIDHEHEDFASIVLGFENDRVAVISSSRITPTRVGRLNAACTGAVISSDFVTQEVRVEKNEGVEVLRSEKKEPLLLEIRNFIGSLEGRSEPRAKPEHAVNATKIAEAALLSSRRGTPIYLELK